MQQRCRVVAATCFGSHATCTCVITTVYDSQHDIRNAHAYANVLTPIPKQQAGSEAAGHQLTGPLQQTALQMPDL